MPAPGMPQLKASDWAEAPFNVYAQSSPLLLAWHAAYWLPNFSWHAIWIAALPAWFTPVVGKAQAGAISPAGAGVPQNEAVVPG